jgi:hypothetical protein
MQSNARQKSPKATKNLKRFSRLRGAGGQQKNGAVFRPRRRKFRFA